MPISVTDNTRDQVMTRLGIVVLMLLVIGGLMLFTPSRWHFDLNDPDFFPLNLVLPLLAAVGAVQAGKALLGWRRLARQGTGQVQLDKAGRLVPGARLGGQWLPGRSAPAGTPVKLLLQCVDLYDADPSEVQARRYTYPHVAWQEAFEGQWPAGGQPLRFEIRLPTTLKRIRDFVERPPRDRVQHQGLRVMRLPFTDPVVNVTADMLPVARAWRLRVQATLPDGDHQAEFELPIEVAAPGDGRRRR